MCQIAMDFLVGARALLTCSTCSSKSFRTHNSAIAPDGLLCQCRDEGAWQGARANTGAVQGGHPCVFLISGKHYYEVEVTDEGLCRIGWSTITADLELGECKPCVLPLLFEPT
jgi:hypothetical protein